MFYLYAKEVFSVHMFANTNFKCGEDIISCVFWKELCRPQKYWNKMQ